ncbi:hypothetical protein [Gayadomonas joobiniege]|uniref:hypothetical protein n=1 Tax=Gayadomonas joobiniege TaxID=1234606 RepID=UPI000378FC8F|nr:hypothetical protein [Gayadomonas joobiniege]
MKVYKLLAAGSVALLVSACSNTPQSSPVADQIPDWVLNPTSDSGLAATDCVRYSGNLSVDSKMVAASTRVELAQQISTKIEAMDKTYAARTDANDESSISNVFSQVSKQITQQTLNGARVVKTDIIQIGGVDQVCSKMELSPAQTQAMLDKLVSTANVDINPQDQKFLYQEFKAYKAQQDLAKEIERLSN